MHCYNDVYINSGTNALLWSLVDHHFMLFLYDKEDILAYCCHEEESINFQSLFPHKNEREEKHKSFKTNKQFSIVMHSSLVCVLHTVVHAFYYSNLHAVCCVHLLLSEQCAINYVHTKTMRKQRILTNLYYSDSIIWKWFNFGTGSNGFDIPE